MASFTESVASGNFTDDGRLVVIREQEITADFLDTLHSERMAKAHMRSSEMEHVASVPTSLVDLWLCQGIPFYQLTPREIVRRLKDDGLDAFITTDKAV